MLNKEELQAAYDKAVATEISSREKNTEDVIRFIEEKIELDVKNLCKRVFFSFASGENNSIKHYLYPRFFNNINVVRLIEYFEDCQFKISIREQSTGYEYKTGEYKEKLINGIKMSRNEILEYYFKNPVGRDIYLTIYFLD